MYVWVVDLGISTGMKEHDCEYLFQQENGPLYVVQVGWFQGQGQDGFGLS